MAPQSSSVFLNIPPSAYIAQNALAFAVRDRYPVSPGHALVIPFRAVETWFDASPEEQAALFALVDVVKAQLDQGVLCADGARRVPDGYNVGFNAGLAAGQTVMHLHVHVIPRFTGDMDDPRGGVRHVIPSKGNYLSPPDRSPHDHSPPPPALLTTGGARSPLLDKLQPLFAQADDIDILVAFVRRSGLACIQDEILSATARGARVRLLTGDYLGITDPDALGALFDLSAVALTPAEHGGEDGADDGADEDIPPAAGSLTARIIETATARPSGLRVFHPKAWRFENPTRGVAFVGSSNLSASALKTGIEWNLGLERSKEPQTFSALRAAFDDLWGQATPLSAAWIDGYRRRRVVIPTRLKATAPAAADAADAADAAVAAVAADAVSFGAEGANDSEDSEDSEDSDELPPLPPPHLVQQEALVALAEARASGRTRALVVLATGLGKTLLAALDYAQMARSLNRLPKLLFIAHRRELLLQAASCYRRLSPSQDPAPRIGWCMEESADLSADAIFASVAKLAQPRVIARLQALCFDYVVIDEVHHAAAPSYQRILAALDARFVLGLTATPERADDRDVFGIFDDFVAYRADIPRGIDLNFLVPFAYHGLKDDIDYAQIPWRNRRFDPEALARAAQTEARMQTLLKAWRAHPGARTVVFCCSVAHAKFTKQWLRAHDIRALAIFSGPDSDDRDAALEELRAGHIDALCAVDLLNEGIDVRALDRVVMLRPTESNVVFLQQLGRGLRACEGKRLLTVIDFVGNHRLFLDRLRALLSLTAQSSPPAAQLRALLRADDPSDADDAAHRDDAPLALPPGCSVELALEAKHQLNKLFHKRADAADVVTSAYQEARLVRGERPTAGELLRSGYDPSSVSKAHDGWFLFVAAQGDLTPEAAAVATAHASWLLDLEQADMTKSFKMILLEALLALGGVSQPVALDSARGQLLAAAGALGGAAGGGARGASPRRQREGCGALARVLAQEPSGSLDSAQKGAPCLDAARRRHDPPQRRSDRGASASDGSLLARACGLQADPLSAQGGAADRRGDPALSRDP
jgi:superfamily II DNA or RNA helicase/HKD family nuclease/diadenosine tetraphosphate (Ap4A) HIT family hydrolase